jgi:hypothetical protein
MAGTRPVYPLQHPPPPLLLLHRVTDKPKPCHIRAELDGPICLLGWGCGRRRESQPAMASSARPGERATSFAIACSLLSRFVRQNSVAAAELGLGIKGEQRNLPSGSALSRSSYFWAFLGFEICGPLSTFFLLILRRGRAAEGACDN